MVGDWHHWHKTTEFWTHLGVIFLVLQNVSFLFTGISYQTQHCYLISTVNQKKPTVSHVSLTAG